MKLRQAADISICAWAQARGDVLVDGVRHCGADFPLDLPLKRSLGPESRVGGPGAMAYPLGHMEEDVMMRLSDWLSCEARV